MYEIKPIPAWESIIWLINILYFILAEVQAFAIASVNNIYNKIALSTRTVAHTLTKMTVLSHTLYM